MTTLRIGFIPLVDAALLIAAREKGFAAKEGLTLELIRDVSWANLRDRLAVGLIDAAHMLAPAAIASTLGIGHMRVEIAAPILLNRNGNAITVSAALFAEMENAAGGPIDGADANAEALALVSADRAAKGADPLVFASVFPFSMHTLLLREWLQRGGLRLGEDVAMVVLPPPFMAQSLANGQIDGFCVGAPWNMLAAQSGTGVIAALGCDLIPDAPEKLLAMRASAVDADPSVAIALARAIRQAATWSHQAHHRAELAGLLAQPAYLDMESGTIEAILHGRVGLGAGRPAVLAPHYLSLDPKGLDPDLASVDFLIEAMLKAGQIEARSVDLPKARAVFRSDLFQHALKQ